MTGSSIIGFRPLTPLSLKPFTSLSMGLHGPGTGAATLSYPTPSTITGALAATLVNASGGTGIIGGCSNRGYDFQDVRCVLESMLGENFRIRTGLAIVLPTTGSHSSAQWHVYLNSESLPLLSSLASGLSKASITLACTSSVDPVDPCRLLGRILRDLLDSDSVLKSSRYGVVGIGLDRVSKSVRTGLLYNLEKVVYPVDSYIIVEVDNADIERIKQIDRHTVKFGGEGGLARIDMLRLDRPPGRIYGDSDKWLLVTTNLSLLDGSPFGHVPSSGGILAENTARNLATMLLERYYGECSISDVMVVYMIKGEMQAEIVFPGWPARGDRPRPPRMVVPAGTVIYLEASRECAERIVAEGLGLHSWLGWGSVVAVGLD